MKYWTELELSWLTENYPLIGKIACANYLNKTIHSIRAKASKLNLKQDKNSDFFINWQNKAAQSKMGKKRPGQAEVIKNLHKSGKLNKTQEQKEKLSKSRKECLKNNEHPRGNLGKKHTQETIDRMSEASKSQWENPDYPLNSIEHRQKLSDRMSLLQSQGKLRNAYSRGRQGRRKDLNNVYFRSSWEANYARYLNFLLSKKLIYKWEFESDVFWFEKIKRGVRSYLPDFKIWETENSKPYYVEVKGWMDDKSKTKIKRMKKYYPNIRLDIVEKKQYMEIKNKLSQIIKGWE